MSLSRVLSRWTAVHQQEPSGHVDQVTDDPSRPVERRTRFTLRRLYDLLRADVVRSQQQALAADEQPAPATAKALVETSV